MNTHPQPSTYPRTLLAQTLTARRERLCRGAHHRVQGQGLEPCLPLSEADGTIDGLVEVLIQVFIKRGNKTSLYLMGWVGIANDGRANLFVSLIVCLIVWPFRFLYMSVCLYVYMSICLCAYMSCCSLYIRSRGREVKSICVSSFQVLCLPVARREESQQSKIWCCFFLVSLLLFGIFCFLSSFSESLHCMQLKVACVEIAPGVFPHSSLTPTPPEKWQGEKF